MAENMLSGFKDGSIWKDPNFQSLLAGLGGAIDQKNGKKGVGGQVGDMFQGYVQSVEAQNAFEQEMKKKDIFTKLMTRYLGLDPKAQIGQVGPTALCGMRESGMSSNQWLTPMQDKMMGGR